MARSGTGLGAGSGGDEENHDFSTGGPSLCLQDVRIHNIRHSFASRALALGEDLPIIGRLLGHRRVETTARYAHLARDSVKESAERIAFSIAADIL